MNASKEMFVKYGIKSVSMNDIARQLGVSKKTLYKIFKTKNELIDLVLEKHYKEEILILTKIKHSCKNAIDEIFKIGKHILNSIGKMSPTLIFDLQKYHGGIFLKMIELESIMVYQTIYKNIIKGMQEGLYRSDLNPDIIAKLYAGQVKTILDQDIFPVQYYPTDLLYKEAFKYHLLGIASKNGLKKLKNYLCEFN